VLRRLAPCAAETRGWPLLLGGGLCLLVVEIPDVGVVVSLVMTLVGLGAGLAGLARSARVSARAL